jgi:hypothetical protein
MMTPRPSGRITPQFVDDWSGRYSPTYDDEVLKEIAPQVAVRQHFTRAEFLTVCQWKTARVRGLVERNSEDDVQELTGVALGAPERHRHRILQLLTGVGEPVASALLMVSDPDRFTVTDFRSRETLRAQDELGPEPIGYYPYVLLCRAIAVRVGRDLRALDRALWQWSKVNGAG